MSLNTVVLDKSFSSSLTEFYHLDKGPDTLDEFAQLWNRMLQGMTETERGKRFLDELNRGEIVYAQSKAETRHTVHLEGGLTVHVYCALDALVEGFFQNIEIESSCPHCQEQISLKMARAQVVFARPDSAVLWLGISPKGEGSTTEVVCPFINFFLSRDHADHWRRENPEQVGVIMTLSQAHEFTQKALASAKSQHDAASSLTRTTIEFIFPE